MALTKEQILQAADQIAAAGETPTLAAVRKSVGGGSYTTINEALKAWKAKQQAAVMPLREPAPEGISKRLDDVGAEVWAIALELANARLTSEREALEATRAQLETAQLEATELADQLSAELEALQAQYLQATESLQSVNAALEQAKQENAALSRQLATTEARAEETTKRADDFKAELHSAQSANHAQRERHAEETKALQAQLTTTEKALQTEVAEVIRLKLELTHAQTQATPAQQQKQTQQERHTHEIQQLGERLTQAQAEREQALQAEGKSREAAAGMRGELEALRVQNAALLATLTPTAPATPKSKATKPLKT